MNARGFDASGWQADPRTGSSLLDCPKLAAQGFRFAIFKAGGGQEGAARSFASHVAGAVNAGIPYVGAYWFFRPSVAPEAQARTFAGLMRGAPLWLPPSCDVERDDGLSSIETTVRVRTFLSALRAELAGDCPGRPLLYTYPFFAGLDHTAALLADEADLWISHPQLVPQHPLVPLPFKTWRFWQVTDDKAARVHVDGYPGNALVDLFNGTDAELDDYVLHRIPNSA